MHFNAMRNREAHQLTEVLAEGSDDDDEFGLEDDDEEKTLRPLAGKAKSDAVGPQGLLSSSSSSSAAASSQGSSKVIKYGALATLVAQNTALVLLMRFSRSNTSKDSRYFASTAVLMMEIVKMAACCGVVFRECGYDTRRFVRHFNKEVATQPKELAKLAVPALLYTVQNTLLFVALTYLDAVVYQLCYQLKILTTAVFSVAMLGRRLSALQWVALLLLTAGVGVVQLSSSPDTTAQDAAAQRTASERVLGFSAVLAACVTSGFSGVYFEKILKGSQTTLWVRNIQLGMTSIVLAAASVVVQDRHNIAQHGFFFGYSGVVWLVISLQAFGGLTVAVVVKYADNILKGFAASYSILASLVIEMVAFGFVPSLSFLAGFALVNLASYLYGRPTKEVPRTS